MRRAWVALACIGLLLGCRAREAFLGVREPTVVGVTAAGATPAATERIAVLVDAPGSVYDIDHRRAIESSVVEVLASRGHRIVARADLDGVLAELGLQHSALTDENAARAGRLLNVPAVMIVRLVELIPVEYAPGSWELKTHLTAKLIGVERGDVQWTASHRGTHFVDGPRSVGDAIQPIARGVARSFPYYAVP